MMLFLVRDKKNKDKAAAYLQSRLYSTRRTILYFRISQSPSVPLTAADPLGTTCVAERTSQQRCSAPGWAVAHLLQFARPVTTGRAAGVPLNTHLECKDQAGTRSDGLRTEPCAHSLSGDMRLGRQSAWKETRN